MPLTEHTAGPCYVLSVPHQGTEGTPHPSPESRELGEGVPRGGVYVWGVPLQRSSESNSGIQGQLGVSTQHL